MTSLKILSLLGTHVADAGLEHLKGLKRLEVLHLHGSQVSNAGMKKFRVALPKCKIPR